jgi:hypothetical protein
MPENSKPDEPRGLDALGPLPVEDRELSPFTGWTRAHWEAAADGLLEGVRPFATPRHALLHLPGGRPSQHGTRSDGLEGFARTFLLAAFRLRGAEGKAPGDLAARYAEGIVAGTRAGSDESWPAIEPLSQPMVEAASIAIGLFETRAWVWDSLPDAARQRVIDWLSGSLGQRHFPNNWLLFQVVVNAFLASVGAPHRPEEVERDLALIDSMYRRDGWYSDGPGQNYDHYVGWAMHLYPLLWCRMGGEEQDPERAAVYRERLGRFLADYAHLFAANGAPLHQGRSLIYRFAAVAPLWAGALAEATPLSPGETRRMASGALRHFLERGALGAGVLSMGWYREFLPMAQPYSGPASAYWASKGFLGLLLPPQHAVWTAREEAMAVERGDFCRAMAEPGFLARGTRADGIVRVSSHKSDHYPFLGDRSDDPHYRKLAYSTHTGPDIGEGGEDLDVDSQVALVSADGQISRRGHVHPIAAADRMAASAFYPGEPAIVGGAAFPIWLERVETVSIARGPAEIRIHHVATFGRRWLRDGGFALADHRPLEVESGEGWCAVRRPDGLVSAAFPLRGFDRAAATRLEGANALGHHSAAPYLRSTGPVPVEGVYASLVVLTGEEFDPRDFASIADLEVKGRQVWIECRDGERFFVQLAAPEPVQARLGRLELSGAVRYARVSPDGGEFVLRS